MTTTSLSATKSPGGKPFVEDAHYQSQVIIHLNARDFPYSMWSRVLALCRRAYRSCVLDLAKDRAAAGQEEWRLVREKEKQRCTECEDEWQRVKNYVQMESSRCTDMVCHAIYYIPPERTEHCRDHCKLESMPEQNPETGRNVVIITK